MSDLSAPSSSNVPIALKRRGPTQQTLKVKRQITIASSLLVPRNSTTALAISKRGLPAPNTAKAKPPAKLADNSWIRAQFVDFTILRRWMKAAPKS